MLARTPFRRNGGYSPMTVAGLMAYKRREGKGADAKKPPPHRQGPVCRSGGRIYFAG